MRAINSLFEKIINGTTQFIIPVFQRDFTWGDDQCLGLWNDIVRTADADSDRGHFLGSIVYVASGDNTAGFTRWLVIDGQQRLTTLTLLLAALRDHIQDTGWVGDENGPTLERIDAYFLKNMQESGNRRPKLVLRRADDETLQAIVNRSDLPDDYSILISDAYALFRERLENADPDLIYRGIAKLVVIDVTLDRNTDNPQLVFESLNSTGVNLSESDLIRNFVLMRLTERDQTRLYEQYWSKIESYFRSSEPALDDFFRDYMALRTKASRQTKNDQIYRVFREESQIFQEQDDGLEGTLQDMTHSARYYAAFRRARTSGGTLELALRNVRRLGPIAAILVMKLYRCHDEFQSLTAEEFVRALELIESYIFRRAICGMETRGYWAVLAGIAYRIDDQQPLQSIQVEFARLRENYRFPSNDEFWQALFEKDMYQLRVCWHLLERLENAGRKELSDTSEYSIEHILPQNEKLPLAWRKMLGTDWRKDHEIWLHRLGNLTLTAYNSKYSDRPFEQKKKMKGGFSESAVRLNKYVRDQSRWTTKEIGNRGKILANRALEIWSELNVDQELIDSANVRENRELATRRDVGQIQMSPKARELFDALKKDVNGLGDVIEIAQRKSVSYHGPDFFLEVLPRKYELVLLLPLDFSEVDDPDEIAEDANDWRFIPNAKYGGGVVLRISRQELIDAAIPIVRQAFNL